MDGLITRNFNSVEELIAAIRKLRGPIYADVIVGAGYDPFEIQIVKGDLLTTLTSDFKPDQPSPFYLLTNSLGAQFLIGVN